MGLNPKQASWNVMDWSQGLLKDGGPAMPKPAGQKQQMPPLRCPRCDSTNTKFCYYNNYSRSQPRHYCKACRRHWTEGGTLRNIPVGGGRRSKRQKTTHNTSTTPNTDTVDKPMTHQQQQQLMLPFNNGFNNILRQVMVPINGFNGRLVASNHSLQPLPSQLTGTKPIDANTSDFYSSYHNYMRQQPITGEEGLASTWQEPAATGGVGVGSSPGYWSGWDYDLTGLVDPELRQPAIDDPRSP